MVAHQIKVIRGKHGLSTDLAWGLQLRTLALSNSGISTFNHQVGNQNKTLTELDNLIDILCN